MVNLGIFKSVAEATGWVSSVAYSQNQMGPGVFVLIPRILIVLSREPIIIHQT